MKLFLDTLGPTAFACLLTDWSIIERIEWDSSLREYDTLLPKIDELLNKRQFTTADIDGIIAVVWPGSFTGMRTVVLTINAIAYARGIPTMPLDVDTLGDGLGWGYPRIRSANRREVMIRDTADSEARYVAMDDIPPGRYWGYADIDDGQMRDISIECPRDYDRFFRTLVFSPAPHRIAPLYVKRPNITLISREKTPGIHLLQQRPG